MDAKILLITDDGALRDQLMDTLENYPNTESITFSEVKMEIDRISPDIIIMTETDGEYEIDLLQYIQREIISSIILFISQSHDFFSLRETVRAGVHDFFVIPDEIAQFKDRLQKSVKLFSEDNEKTSNISLGRGRGSVVSFFSGKGGAGKTLVASTYAQTLQLESHSEVVLLDLNLQYGGVETYMNIDSNRSIVDLQPVINELNENHIRNVTEAEEHSKIEVLLSPRDAEKAENINDADIARIIRACRRSYDFVVIDLPAEMNANTHAALEESEKIYYVMNLDTISLRIFSQVEQLFTRLGMDTSDRLELIVNMKNNTNELKLDDLKNFIAANISSVQLRRDEKGVQPLLNQGEPLRKSAEEKKLSALAKDIRKWVHTQNKS
ncbi:AAA family ATPase [Natribacillus halophilus]|uniref:Pilus assembly protein CpaE n=1 Tax=Natribacillus halophilus TaxID=549003 RepID=A0A1G8QBP3_9BACI|nr:AAA family ATPase [Natribacillus halophilus]SDJ02214.1 pilus assembly protein CpaE [Natribacillus halophilus]